MATNTFTQNLNTVETITNEITTIYALAKIPYVFEVKYLGRINYNVKLKVNPSSISLSRNPVNTVTRTRTGIINNFWRPEPDRLSLAGMVAGTKAADGLFRLKQISDSLQSSAEQISNIVKFKYKGKAYEGWISNFQLSVEANNPKIFNYSFEFNFASNSDSFNYILLCKQAGEQSQAEITRELGEKAAKFVAQSILDEYSPVFLDESAKVINAAANVGVNFIQD